MTDVSMMSQRELIQALLLVTKQWKTISSLASCDHVSSFISSETVLDNLNPMYRLAIKDESVKKTITSNYPRYIIILLIYTKQDQVDAINQKTQTIELPRDIQHFKSCIQTVAILSS